jgi:hypothetical protein
MIWRSRLDSYYGAFSLPACPNASPGCCPTANQITIAGGIVSTLSCGIWPGFIAAMPEVEVDAGIFLGAFLENEDVVAYAAWRSRGACLRGRPYNG